MEEIRTFNGTMDLDSAAEYVAQGDYGEAHNIKISPSVGSTGGRVNFCNDLVLNDSLQLPPGTNKTLKAVSSDSMDKVYTLNYNSQGLHTIVEYGPTGTVLFTNKTDTAGQDLFGWDDQTFINDLILHLDRWLVFTDGKGEVRMLDIDKLKNGYGRAVTLEDTTLGKPSPKRSPYFDYLDVPTLSSNNLINKIFKFKYKYIYEGGYESSWSAGTPDEIPNNLNAITTGYENVKQNAIRLNIYIDHANIERVVVAMSYNGGEWVIIRDEKFSDIQTLPSTTIDPLGETYLAPGWWQPIFTNPYSFTLITADEADYNYNAIPRSAKSLDVVNNSVMLLGGLEEGYAPIENLNVALTPTSFPSGIDGTVIGRGTLKVKRIDRNQRWDDGDYYHESTYIELEGTPTPGDVITLVCEYGFAGKPRVVGQSLANATVYSYTVAPTDTSLAIVYQNFSKLLPRGGVSLSPEYMYFMPTSVAGADGMSDHKTLTKVDIDLQDIGYVDVNSVRTFKKGSRLQFALSYKDAMGRYFPLASSEAFKVSFPSPAVASNLGYRLNWNIYHTPPAGAVSYQWMVSEDEKHLKYTELIGEIKRTMSKKGKFITLDLSPLNRFLNRGLKGVDYEFLPGDRVYIMGMWNGVNGAYLTTPYITDLNLDLAVLSYKVEGETTETSRNLLNIEYNQKLWDALTYINWTNDEAALRIQIYTPKSISDQVNTTVFREIGPVYPILSGAHSVSSGTLEGIDDFLRGRVFEAFSTDIARSFTIESRNPTEDSEDLTIFRGNFRSLGDQRSELNLKGSIRFSDVSNINMNYNGINKFFEGRIYGEGPGETTAKHGWITKIKVVGNYLKVLQENEVGTVPVYLSMIQDNSGSIQTADSDKILNIVRYLGNGKVGTGKDARSFAISNEGVIFFFDNDRKVPYMLQGMTLDNITRKIGTFISKNVLESTLGSYAFVHQNFKQYWMTYKAQDGGIKTLVFDHGQNGWRCFSDNIPEAVANLNDSVHSFKSGARHTMSKDVSLNNYYGNSYESVITGIYPGSMVRTFQSIAVHSDTVPATTEDGVVTELGYTSDLVEKDFKEREGIFYANFWRDKATGLHNGKLLKGSWIKVSLKFLPKGFLNLLKVVVKSKGSTPNE